MTQTFVRTMRPAAATFEIRLACPDRLNAIDEDVLAGIDTALDESAADDAVRVVVIAGEGRAFCAGANYKKHVRDERTMFQKREYIDAIFRTFRRIHLFEKPVVAAVHGIAVGAGAELAINCDFIAMAEDAELWFPEVAIGTFMGCGATVLLPRLVGLARARRMLLLGERLRGAEAVAAGLATHCFAATVFEQGVLNLAGDIAARAPVALRLGKSHLNAGITRDYETALLAERDAVLACMMTDDWKEGVRAFAEKRKPVFGGR